MPSVAWSQTSILEPFEFVAHVAVGTNEGRRPLSGADVVLDAGENLMSTAGLHGGNAGTPSGYSGSIRTIARRDVDGVLLEYQVKSERSSLPVLFLQNGTRWVGAPKPVVSAPPTGGVVADWVDDGLCSVVARVDVGDSKGTPTSFRLTASGPDWQSGFSLNKAETGVPANVEGFVRSQVGGAPWLAGEFLARPGIPLELSATVTASDNSELAGFGVVTVDAVDCPAEVSIELKPVDDDGGNPDDALKGKVDAFVRLVADARVPSPLKPTQSMPFPTVEGLTSGAWGLLLPSGANSNGYLKHSGKPSVGRYHLNVATWVSWANGRSATLSVGRNAQPGHFSPMVPFPLSGGREKGLYPDLSFTLDENEVETFYFDGQFLVAEGAIEPIGCVAPDDIRSGNVEWFEEVLSPDGSFVDEDGDEHPTTITAGRASAAFETGSGRYRLPVMEGDWREASYSVRFQRSGNAPGLPALDADIAWTVPRSSMSRVSVSGDDPPAMLVRSLPFSAATVTLQAVEPGTGRPLPFRAPVVSVSGAAVAGAPPVRDWTVTARGANEMRTQHRVVVPSFPGQHDLSIHAFVAQDSTGVGTELKMSFPSIRQVPFRAPRADDSCAAKCADPDGKRYWDDDMTPPTVEFDPLPAVVHGPFLNVTGRAFDESPIMSVTVGGVEAELEGTDTRNHREFKVRVPIDDSMQEVTVVVRDRCGQETVVAIPLAWERNTPPVIDPIPVVYVDEGQFVSVNVTATDPDEDQELTFSLDTTGLLGESVPVIDPVTGTISWTPDFTQSGTWTFVVSVTDGIDSASAPVIFEVRDVNRPPIIVRVGGQQAAKQMLFRYEANKPLALHVEAIDPDDDPITLVATGVESDLPPGMSLSASDVLIWVPQSAQAGREYVVDVTASDPKGGIDNVHLVFQPKGQLGPADKTLGSFLVAHGGGLGCQSAGTPTLGLLLLVATLILRRGGRER